MDGDFVAAIGAPVMFGGSVVYVQASGTVVFAGIAGVGWTTGGQILSWQRGDIYKVAAPYDTAPGTDTYYDGCTLPSSLAAPVNNAAETENVVFRCSYPGGAGLFMAGALGGPAVNIVKSGDPAPTGGTFTTNTFDSYLINDASQVAFLATTSSGATGIFVASAGVAPAKVVATGDAAPGGGTFSALTTPLPVGFTPGGAVLFFASVSGGAGGLFLGTASRAPQAVAANGAAAPSGGNYAFSSSSRDVRANAAGDILFQAPLSGGSADSGLFLKRAATGLVETVALQGQTAPGTTYPFATIATTINALPGEMTALGPSGEAWFNTTLNLGDRFVMALYRYRPEGALEKVTMRGDAAPGGIGGTLINSSQGIGAGRPGVFCFRGVVTGGSDADVLYVTALAVPGDLTGDGRADLAVFRPSTGTWYIKGQAPVVLGAAGDVPVPADYNGDGLNEIAVYRPATGTWRIQGQADVSFGQAGDIPAPGDYNGDGATEIAVFRPSGAPGW